MNETRHLLPPMAALNSFVAAARHGSFSRAGQQIGLTQSAVSRQVAILEDWLQTSLFDRNGRRVSLNAAGAAYAEQIRIALDRIRSATQQTMRQADKRELSIATLPSFGMRWLAPRLPDLTARHPDMTVNFAARSFPFDLRDEGFDAAIHFGPPDWPHASHLFLFREKMVAVCAPDWLRRHNVREPEDLIGKPLLFQASRLTAWNRWFASCGHSELPPVKGPVFEHFLMLAQAAAGGVGAALIPRFLIAPELEAKMLVIPFEHVLQDENAYYLVRRSDWESNPALVDFSDWIATQTSSG
ncbi:LysR family transcriptional regulator [Novosphingobium sp. PC22D]|uniref:LysR substrate-binding domain-containing protein n=1 Tax=Novosphingobium sp. PC22D TaxID=1962403 RepID=UPI000BEFA07A|nr:LysR substrate-binding domain-containing protein [Novosphingobium sp. PC22D]PEQ14086.1 LysR family transcriptional regulator [Novosphingobium sp. PC22D]